MESVAELWMVVAVSSNSAVLLREESGASSVGID